jgi:anti-anti-sigma factor
MISVEKTGRIDIVSFSVNKINALVSEEITAEISRVFEASGSKVIIDLNGVEYIDSSGFGCLLSLMRTAKNRYGQLKLARPEPAIRKLLSALYLDTVFQVYEDIDTCLGSFR